MIVEGAGRLPTKAGSSSARGPIANLLGILKSNVFRVTSKFFVQAIIVEGVLKGTDDVYRCLFVNDGSFGEYLREKFFVDSGQRVGRRRIWSKKSLRRLIESRSEDCDLCIAVLSPAYAPYLEGLGGFVSQESMSQTIDISGGPEDVKFRSQKKANEAGRKIRRNNWSYRISRSTEDFDVFYERMYVVQKVKKFGRLAAIKSREVMREFFDKGFLLQVMENGMPVAAGINYVEGDRLSCRESGVLDADDAYDKQGAQLAVYHFNIQYARELGLRCVDLRSSRPFANDGPFVHKTRWGATVSLNPDLNSKVYIFNLGAADKIARFFAHCPMIVATHSGLRALLGVETHEPLPEKDCDELAERLYVHGLAGLVVLTAASKTALEIAFPKRHA